MRIRSIARALMLALSFVPALASATTPEVAAELAAARRDLATAVFHAHPGRLLLQPAHGGGGCRADVVEAPEP